MYVKLVNPRNRATQVFEAKVGDVHYSPKSPMDQKLQDLWSDEIRASNWDERRFVVWPRDWTPDTEVSLTEITIPGLKASQTVVVLTNWDAYLVNESGRTIDRIHRYAEENPAQLPLVAEQT